MSPLEDLLAVYYPTVTAHLVPSGELGTTSFTPGCCGMANEHGASCSIICKGYADSGWLLTLTGPTPFKQRQYECKTHHRIFSITDSVFLNWLYGPDSKHTWDDLQPDPLFVKFGQTYYTAELLWYFVSQFEQRVTINQIMHTLHQNWLGIWQERLESFIRHALAEQPDFDVTSLPPPDVPYWVHMRSGHNIATDRSKLMDLLCAYFDMFLQPDFMTDLQTAREQLCYGLSIDETFKVAVKCSIAATRDPAQPPGRDNVVYASPASAVHTIYSSSTQMMVACRFMLTKSAADKAVCVKEVLAAQAAAMATGRAVQCTKYVATDNPVQDFGMLQSVNRDVFGLDVDDLSVGDDVWHAYPWHSATLAFRCSSTCIACFPQASVSPDLQEGQVRGCLA